MEKMQFHVPLRLHVDGETHEIVSVREALTFLDAWPSSRRGPVFTCASNSCQAALGGMMRVDDARKAFESFARITGILATEDHLAAELVAAKAAQPTVPAH
jgi:uncharacterized protein DUF982